MRHLRPLHTLEDVHLHGMEEAVGYNDRNRSVYVYIYAHHSETTVELIKQLLPVPDVSV